MPSPRAELPACSVGMGRPLQAWAQLGSGQLVPDLEEGVPGACGHSHAIVSDSKTAHSVVVASENTCEQEEHENHSCGNS